MTALWDRVLAWAMLPTPFSSDRSSVDIESCRSLVRHQLDNGCGGVIALGVIAEPEAMTDDEKCRVIDAALTAAGGNPVIVSSMSLDRHQRDLELRSIRIQFGSSVAAVMLPVTSKDLVVVRADVDHAAQVSGRPIVLQDYPQASGVGISVEALAGLIVADPRIVGVKYEAAPTFVGIRHLRTAQPGLHVIAGGGTGLVEDVMAGADSAACQTTAVGSLCGAVRLALLGRYDDARTVVAAQSSLIHFELQQKSSIAIRKEHWRRMGVIAHAGVRGDRVRYTPELDEISSSLGYRDPEAGAL